MEALRGEGLMRHGQNTCTDVRPELGHTKRNLANLVTRNPSELFTAADKCNFN